MSSMYAFAQGSSSEDSDSDNNDFLHPSTDPNADEFNDYNPRKRRRTGRDAKESAALGIFGSESEDEGPGKRWKKKSLRGKGMSFVSTGQKQLDDDEDEDDDEIDQDADMDAEEEKEEEEAKTEVPQGRLGLGARGLGFQSPAPAKQKQPSSFGTPLGPGFVPKSAGVPILRDFDDEKPSTPRVPQRSAFETPQKGTPKGLSFAERQMAKMGYKQGQGLGREGQGRAAPIEVKLRPQGVGIGAVREKSQQEKEEEKRQAKLKGVKYEDSDEERKKARRSKPKSSGVSSGVSTPRRAPKPKFQTLEEVQKSAPGLHIPESYASILDMTGPERKLLTSAAGLSTPSTPSTETIEEKEDKRRMKVALRAQREIDSFGQQWINLQERKQWIDEQLRQEQKALDQEQDELGIFTSFAKNVQGLSQAASDGQWDPVVKLLKDVESLDLSDSNDELSTIAVAAVHPFLRQAVEGWQPLDDPKLNGMAPTLHSIRHIIGAVPSKADVVQRDAFMINGRGRAKSTTPYETMIYKIIFPKIISSIPNWNAYKPSQMLALLEAWDGLLPGFVRSQLLRAIVGKLDDAVSSWEPRKKRHNELPHLWLFPWLQYLPAHHADPQASVGLVSDIKRKFRKLIDVWDFHRGVIPGLEQWREVLCVSTNIDQWTPLIMNHVLPGMAKFLRDPKNFQVDPNDQAPFMAALQGIFAWKDILKARTVGQVIVETVFPMWHNVLHQWLTVVGPNEEIGQWFEWWRDEVFPAELKHLQSIEKEFEKGHEMINTALDLGPRAATHLPAPSRESAIPRARSSPPPVPATPAAAPVAEEYTFRHKVEDWCIENELQFLPEKKVLHAAGPLFRMTAAGHGKNGTLVYFKGDSLIALSKKGADQVEIRIDWEDADARDVLLGMAWTNVK